MASNPGNFLHKHEQEINSQSPTYFISSSAAGRLIRVPAVVLFYFLLFNHPLLALLLFSRMLLTIVYTSHPVGSQLSLLDAQTKQFCLNQIGALEHKRLQRLRSTSSIRFKVPDDAKIGLVCYVRSDRNYQNYRFREVKFIKTYLTTLKIKCNY